MADPQQQQVTEVEEPVAETMSPSGRRGDARPRPLMEPQPPRDKSAQEKFLDVCEGRSAVMGGSGADGGSSGADGGVL